MATKDNIGKEPQDVSQKDVVLKEEASEMKEQAKKAIQLIKEKASEEDPKLTPALTLRTILGGDFLTADMVRRQIWLFVLMVVFCIAYVAVRTSANKTCSRSTSWRTN